MRWPTHAGVVVVARTSEAVVYLENGLALNHQILQKPRRACNRTWHEVTMYFRPEVIDVRKRAENDASDGFGSNSSGAAFCLPTNWWASCCVMHSSKSDSANPLAVRHDIMTITASEATASSSNNNKQVDRTFFVLLWGVGATGGDSFGVSWNFFVTVKTCFGKPILVSPSFVCGQRRIPGE